MPLASQLSRRERQIMDIVYELSETPAKVMEAPLAKFSGYSAIRATMNKLETKDFLVHRQGDLKYIYYRLIDRQEAREPALQKLLKTFFESSASQAMSTLLDLSKDSVTEKELDALNQLLEKAKKKLKK